MYRVFSARVTEGSRSSEESVVALFMGFSEDEASASVTIYSLELDQQAGPRDA